MTKKELFTAIITELNNNAINFRSELAEDATATIPAKLARTLLYFSEKELAILAKRSETRKNTTSKTQQANAKIKEELLAFITEQGKELSCAEIAANFKAFSTQKISALLTQMVESGTIEKIQEKRKVSYKCKN